MKSVSSLLCLAVVLALAPRLAAVTYPQPIGDPVSDFAEVLPPEAEQKIAQLAGEVRARQGVPIVVVTVRSLAEHGAGSWSIDRFAAGLYNDWGIGSAQENLGLLLLVAVADRKLRIASGAGFGASWDAPAREIIDREIVPRFKRGDLAGGIVAGVQAMALRTLQAERAPEEAPGPGAVPSPSPARSPPPAPARSPAPVPVSFPGGDGAPWSPRGTGLGPPGRGSSGLGVLVFFVFVMVAFAAVAAVLRGLLRASTGGGSPTASATGAGGAGGTSEAEGSSGAAGSPRGAGPPSARALPSAAATRRGAGPRAPGEAERRRGEERRRETWRRRRRAWT